MLNGSMKSKLVVHSTPTCAPMVVASTSAATPCPEFMWCQRSDRVYVTIKVADCTDAEVNVTPDMVFTFSGTGHGMCGRARVQARGGAGAAVVPEECCWFASGPSVRVRLQKANVGPYWAGLLAGKRKMPQLKVDWASWLDEDEENERSTAPNGFDVSEMKMQLVGSDKDPLYRDLDRFDSSTSPDEGEEMNSILIDEGESKLADVNLKMKALDYEKEEVAKARARRFELRKRTREAQLAQQQRERDLRFGRPARDLTTEEEELLAAADGLYAQLKQEKEREKAYWLGKWWHQRRPERRKMEVAEPLARDAAKEAVAQELDALKARGIDPTSAGARRAGAARLFARAVRRARQIQRVGLDVRREAARADGGGAQVLRAGHRHQRHGRSRAGAGGAAPENLPLSLQMKQFTDEADAAAAIALRVRTTATMKKTGRRATTTVTAGSLRRRHNRPRRRVRGRRSARPHCRGRPRRGRRHLGARGERRAVGEDEDSDDLALALEDNDEKQEGDDDAGVVV